MDNSGEFDYLEIKSYDFNDTYEGEKSGNADCITEVRDVREVRPAKSIPMSRINFCKRLDNMRQRGFITTTSGAHTGPA